MREIVAGPASGTSVFLQLAVDCGNHQIVTVPGRGVSTHRLDGPEMRVTYKELPRRHRSATEVDGAAGVRNRPSPILREFAKVHVVRIRQTETVSEEWIVFFVADIEGLLHRVFRP